MLRSPRPPGSLSEDGILKKQGLRKKEKQSNNSTDITQNKNSWHSHYDGDDKESVLMNLKAHKPKSARGYARYSVILLRLQKDARTDRPPPGHYNQWAGVSPKKVENLRAEDSGLYEVVVQTSKISSLNATRQTKQKKPTTLLTQK